MTKIDELPASRELDVLVAENVISRPFRRPTHGPCCTCQVCGWSFDDCLCGFGEDIEMAMEAVSVLREQGRHLFLNDTLSAYRALFFVIEDLHEFPDLERVGNLSRYAYADTIPLAICRAALKTIKEEGNDGENPNTPGEIELHRS